MTNHSEINIDELERLANAATPGPWSSSESKGTKGHGFCAQVWDKNGNALIRHEVISQQANADVNLAIGNNVWNQ